MQIATLDRLEAFVTLDGSGVIMPQLMSGQVFTTFSTLDPLIISRQPGRPNFDFRFVYNSARNSIWAPCSPGRAVR